MRANRCQALWLYIFGIVIAGTMLPTGCVNGRPMSETDIKAERERADSQSLGTAEYSDRIRDNEDRQKNGLAPLTMDGKETYPPRDPWERGRFREDL